VKYRRSTAVEHRAQCLAADLQQPEPGGIAVADVLHDVQPEMYPREADERLPARAGQ